MSFTMGPEPSFDDMWDAKPRSTPRPRPKMRRPTPPPDRVVGEFSMYLNDKIQERERKAKLEELQQRLQEENKKKFDFEMRLDKMKSLVINILVPAFVIISILLGGAFFVMPDKKPEQFQEKRTLQVQEAPKKGSPTITRSP